MKKFLAINGSPRRNGNIATLLKSAAKGAEEVGAEAKIINLYSLKFKGCTSCFFCKLKNHEHGICAMKDDLTPILEEIKTADAIIFGSPIYFMNLTSGIIAFFERLFFSNYLYNKENAMVFPKKLPSAFFYAMNMTEENFANFPVVQQITNWYENIAANMFGYKPEILYAYNTLQFKDYSKYEANIFSEADKKAYREENFQKLCDKAHELGKKLLQEV